MTRPLALLALLAACATAQPLPPLVQPPNAPERRELPTDPADEPLPPGIPAGESVEPLEAGSCYDASGLQGGNYPCPRVSGILATEAWAVRAGFYRVRYRELREHYLADRTVWTAHRALYETVHAENVRRLREAQPTWFERNAFPLGVGAGIIIGAGVVLAIGSALR